MKIAILTQYPLDPNHPQGGVETSMISLLNELKTYPDLDINVITVTKLINKDVIFKNEDNIKYHYLSSPKLPNLITSLSIDQIRIKRKIREINPDIVHGHMTAPFYGYPALKSKKGKVIITVHGIINEESKSWKGCSGFIKRHIFVPMENKVLREAKILLVVSPYVATKISNRTEANIHVVPNGVQDDFFDIKNNEIENRLLFVGGIEPRKDLLTLFRAINMIRNNFPSIELHIIGVIRNNAYYKELVDFIEKNNLSRNILFKGSLNKDEIKKEYSECSIFVFPSREESQGIVLLEAMAAGKPIVATRIGGIPYIVKHEETGLLIEYGNPEKLGESISILLENGVLRREMGCKGIKVAKEYTGKAIAEKIHAIYYN